MRKKSKIRENNLLPVGCALAIFFPSVLTHCMSSLGKKNNNISHMRTKKINKKITIFWGLGDWFLF